MTTGLTVSITDELVSELEALASKSEIRDEQCMSGVTFGDIRALLAERAELLRDARRYQALRKMHWSDSKLSVVADPKNNVKLGADCPSLERLDTAIDAAMQSKAKQ